MVSYLTYSNQGAIRNQPLSNQLVGALSFLEDMGLTADVFSGGQPGIGTSSRRTGSTRHDHGNAADVLFYDNGVQVDPKTPEGQAIYEEIVRRGVGAGLTGFGYGPGYMGDAMHLGYGARAVWGKDGAVQNAVPWFAQAYNNAIAGRAPQQQNTVLGLIDQGAEKYGLNPQDMRTLAWIESKFNPNAKNPTSSASGIFQFLNGTARQYGLTDPFDPVANIDAGMRFTRDNARQLRRVLGRDPDVGELYLAHQQGIGGATKLLSNPNARAVDLVGMDAVRLNGGDANMTAGQFADIWMSKARSFADTDFASNDRGVQGVDVEDYLNRFDESLMNISTRGNPGQLGMFAEMQDPLKLSPRYHIAAAMSNIGDRLVALGTGNPMPATRAGDAILDRARGRESRNATAEMLHQQGYPQLANMVITGQMSGADAMAMIMAPMEDNRTALQQNYEYAINELGMSPEDARAWVKGGITVNTGEVDLNATESKNTFFYSMAQDALDTIDTVEQQGLNWTQSMLPTIWQSDEYRVFDNAMLQLAEAMLRIETGAAAQQSEIERVRRRIAPVPGDPMSEVQRKNALRRRLVETIGLTTGQGKDIVDALPGSGTQPPPTTGTTGGTTGRPNFDE